MIGGDINRDSVPLCHLSANGLEKEAIINCPTVCSEVGLIYYAVGARNADLPNGASLLKIKRMKGQ